MSVSVANASLGRPTSSSRGTYRTELSIGYKLSKGYAMQRAAGDRSGLGMTWAK